MSLHKADGMTLYTNCEKSMNRPRLCNRADRLNDSGPWKILYKPPIKKRAGDLQWRILHGAITTNAYLTVVNGSVLNKCPFCNLAENIFHVFTVLEAEGVKRS